MFRADLFQLLLQLPYGRVFGLTITESCSKTAASRQDAQLRKSLLLLFAYALCLWDVPLSIVIVIAAMFARLTFVMVSVGQMR